MAFNIKIEEKCGFIISEKRKKLWKVELEIFSEFDRICRKHQLKYFLIGGSAIGVERHKGFIPWDDDLDIGMLRNDFERFLKCAKNELPEALSVQYGVDNIDDASTFCRVRKENTTAIVHGQFGQKCNHGVFIELYPLDNVPESRVLQYVQLEFSSLFRQLIEARYRSNLPKGKLLRVFELLFKGVSTKQLFAIWNWICGWYNRKETQMVNSVSMPHYAKDKFCYYRREDVGDTVYKEFEDTFVQVPVNNDRVLRDYFGDYMQFPPLEERGMHHQTVVYFDPDISWEQALASGCPQRFFAGEYELGRL